MARILFLAALVLTLSVPAAALAHPGHDHKLMGTITTVDGNKVAMKTTEGKDTTFEVVPATVFKRGKAKGAVADLKAGLRVVVNVGNGAEPLKAKEIQYAAPATTSQKH
jgi:hypothetical protein